MKIRHRPTEAGYSMVALMVAVTILTILTAMALPVWSQRMQREKEEELIFRGWQYAEAIRVFQQRHGRLPTRLEELIEVEPRSIRQLWKDPMTEDGEWGIVVQVGGGPGTPVNPGNPNDPSNQVGVNLQQPQNPQNPPTDANGRPQRQGPGDQQNEGVCVGASGGEDEDGAGGRPAGSRGPASRGNRPGLGGSNGQQQVTGPILGVCSRAQGDSVKVLFGEEEYSKWHFTVQRLMAPRSQVGGNPRDAYPQRAEWLGRPFRPGIQPETGAPPASSLPDGSTPNDQQKRP
jgi:type II secretory pathway pseudopilin PulG